jgi:SOS-response transcriptional repressor LexA
VENAPHIPRGHSRRIPIKGIIENDVWRTEGQADLGHVPAHEDDPGSTSAYIVHGRGAAEIGIAHGCIVLVNENTEPTPGSLVLVRRRRDELVEYSLRKVRANASIHFTSLSRSDQPAELTASRPGEEVEIVGHLVRAIYLFPNN